MPPAGSPTAVRHAMMAASVDERERPSRSGATRAASGDTTPAPSHEPRIAATIMRMSVFASTGTSAGEDERLGDRRQRVADVQRAGDPLVAHHAPLAEDRRRRGERADAERVEEVREEPGGDARRPSASPARPSRRPRGGRPERGRRGRRSRTDRARRRERASHPWRAGRGTTGRGGLSSTRLPCVAAPRILSVATAHVDGACGRRMWTAHVGGVCRRRVFGLGDGRGRLAVHGIRDTISRPRPSPSRRRA